MTSLQEKDERIVNLREQLQNISAMGAGFSDTVSNKHHCDLMRCILLIPHQNDFAVSAIILHVWIEVKHKFEVCMFIFPISASFVRITN